MLIRLRSLIGRRAIVSSVSAKGDLRKTVDGSCIVEALDAGLMVNVCPLKDAAEDKNTPVVGHASFRNPVRAPVMDCRSSGTLSATIQREGAESRERIRVLFVIVNDGVPAEDVILFVDLVIDLGIGTHDVLKKLGADSVVVSVAAELIWHRHVGRKESTL